jgi:hypothetical protein
MLINILFYKLYSLIIIVPLLYLDRV